MKKLISLVLVLTLAMAVMVGSAFAATDPTVSVGSATAKAGETVTLNVVGSEVAVMSGKLVLTYDTSVLTMTGATAVSVGMVQPNVDKGIIAFGGTGNVTGTLFTVTFAIAEGAAAGTYPVSIDVAKSYTELEDYSELSVNPVAGAITVEGEPTPPPHEHVWGDWEYQDADLHVSKCECGKFKTEPHAWDNGEVTTEPAVGVAGEKTYTCSVCGGTKTEAIDPLPQPSEKPVDPDPTDKPVDPDPTDKPVDPDPTDKPVDPDPTDKPVDPDPTDKPVDPDPTDKPVDPDPTDKPVDPDPTDKPEDDKPGKSHKTGEAFVALWVALFVVAGATVVVMTKKKEN